MRDSTSSHNTTKETLPGFESVTFPSQCLQATGAYREDDSTWQSEALPFDTSNPIAISYSNSTSYRSEDGAHSSVGPDSSRTRHKTNDSHHPGCSNDRTQTIQLIEDGLAASLQFGGSNTHARDAAAELLALRHLPPQPSQREYMADVSNAASQPSAISPSSSLALPPDFDEHQLLDKNIFQGADGIFHPGSAYRELHSTLRDHLIYTAWSNAPSRSGTPEQQEPRIGLLIRDDGDEDGIESEPESGRSSKPTEVTPQREYILWKTWIDEVAPWVRWLFLPLFLELDDLLRGSAAG